MHVYKNPLQSLWLLMLHRGCMIVSGSVKMSRHGFLVCSLVDSLRFGTDSKGH